MLTGFLIAALSRHLPATLTLPAGTPEGLPTGSDWSTIKIIGVFAGIPLAAMVLITALVMLQSRGRSQRSGTGAAAVFSGPYAGGLEVADSSPSSESSGAATETGKDRETGQDSGMHREVTRPAGGSGAGW